MFHFLGRPMMLQGIKKEKKSDSVERRRRRKLYFTEFNIFAGVSLVHYVQNEYKMKKKAKNRRAKKENETSRIRTFHIFRVTKGAKHEISAHSCVVVDDIGM